MSEIAKTRLTIAASTFYIIGVISFFTNNIFIFAFLALIVLLIALKKDFISAKSACIFYMLFAIAILNCHFQIKNFDALSEYVYTNGTIKGVVDSIPTTNIAGRTKFYLRTDEYNTEKAHLRNIKARTIVTLYDKDENLAKIKIGDRIELSGKLRKPVSAKNPSQFDYAKYLKNHKTFSTFYSKGNNWQIISKPDKFSGKFLQKLNDKRVEIINIHKKYMKSPNLEVLGGIVFGDDAINPPDDIKSSFINSGLLHILAASGMNVSIIFGIWFFLAMRMKLNYRFAILIGAILVAFYTLMTGMGPSVLRAALMIEFVLFGKLIDRNADGISLVFFVALLLLLYNPAMINDVGFQLSFIVTFALMFNCPPVLENIKNKFGEFIAGAVMIPVVAQLWAAPIQMFYFNTFALYSVFANLAITPFIMSISFLGFLGSIIAMIPVKVLADKTCMVFDFILNPIVSVLVNISNYFSALPNSLIATSHPDLFKLFLYYSILFVIGFSIRNKFKDKRLLHFIFVLLIIFFFSFIRIEKNNLEILVFDVGNADSFLIKTPQKKYVLIDTGHGSITSNFSQADAIINKYLKDNGIKSLDLMILTHFDSDHSGGAIDVMKTVEVKKVLLNKDKDDSKTTKMIAKYIKSKNINASDANNNEILLEEQGFKLISYTPDFKEDKNDNDNSIITLLSYGDFDMLFMADGGIRSFDKIKKNLPENKKIEILKVGHHGANNVVSNKMLKFLKSDVAVISTGYNTYGHPRKETLRILSKNNVKIYRTDLNNALKIVSDGEKYEVYKFNTRNKEFSKDIELRSDYVSDIMEKN